MVKMYKKKGYLKHGVLKNTAFGLWFENGESRMDGSLAFVGLFKERRKRRKWLS
jgi:hypothetical protein